MEALRCIMPALTASSVAMTIGALTRQVEWTAPLPERDGPWWSLAPVLFIAGAVIGSLLAGPAAARFGNRVGMAWFDAFLLAGLIASSIVVTFPESVLSEETKIAGRLFVGIGCGGLCAIIPAYVGEVTHRKIRGRLGLLFPAIAAIGVMITATSEKIFAEHCEQPSNVTTFSACWMSIVVILHMIGLCFVPDTPYFISNGLFEQDPFVAGLMDEYQRAESLHILYRTNFYEAFRQSSRGVMNAFAWHGDRKAVLIGLGSMFFHQMSGINTVNSYLADVMNRSDLNVDPNTVYIALGAVQVIMAGVAMTVIDQKGRRFLLLSSAVAMALSLAGLTCLTLVFQHNVEMLSMILATIFIVAYHLGFGPVPWVIVGEIFSTKVKPYGISLSSAMNWLMVIARVYFPYAVYLYFNTEYIFFVHNVVCLSAAIFAWKIVLETKKSSLLEVQLEIDASFEVVSYIPV